MENREFFDIRTFYFFKRERVIRQKFQFQFNIEKPRLDLLKISMTFFDISVLCNRFPKA